MYCTFKGTLHSPSARFLIYLSVLFITVLVFAEVLCEIVLL